MRQARVTYVGTDGRTYIGKAIKPRKRLERRQLAHNVYMSKHTNIPEGSYKLPGSMSK